MATVTSIRVRGRPAHPAGPTVLAYTPNGKKLITAGSNNVVRVYETGSDGEPINIDDCSENNTAVAATNDFFILGSEDGAVCQYMLETNQYEKLLTRCTLPIRDISLSRDGKWAAVASDETTIKIINTEDTLKVIHLRDCPKPAKHITFHPSGLYLAASCTDGTVYVYSISSEEPQLIHKIDGIIRPLETDAEASSRAIWHPDGRAFAAPTATRDVQVVSRSDGEKQKAFAATHVGDVTALAWSPNGALLATAGADGKIVIWETSMQKALARYDYPNVINISWHPSQNIFSFATSDGEIFIYENFLQDEHAPRLQEALQTAPFSHDPLTETSGNARKGLTNGGKPQDETRAQRRGSPDSLDEILGDVDDEDDFVVDDDGAGYTLVNRNGKRPSDHFGDAQNGSKRHAGLGAWEPQIHEAFQPGSTPWRGNRRYLCLNLIGFAWTVDQETHCTVTVEFYDREFHRDFHFTDPYRYDKACLNEKGALFSCPPRLGQPAMVYYRPHESWTARADWRTMLPPGEDVTSLALSDSYIVVTTTANYVRIYTLYGTPFRVYRQKSTPAVTCAAWRDYVLTIGNGAIDSSGRPRLVYTLENVRRDEICQSEDTVALSPSADLRTVLFTDAGDPCISDSEGVLLVLQHWRQPGQARWVPLLDTRLLDRLASGLKEESYWPVAVARNKFHCIILKGGDKYPYFPRPLLSEFDFQIPISSRAQDKPKRSEGEGEGEDEEAAADDSVDKEAAGLEEAYVRESLAHSLLDDLVGATRASAAQRQTLARRAAEADKALLQLLNVECRAGEERGAKALELCTLVRDRTGRVLAAAQKIAERYGRDVLADKARELAEVRMAGADQDEDGIEDRVEGVAEP